MIQTESIKNNSICCRYSFIVSAIPDFSGVGGHSLPLPPFYMQAYKYRLINFKNQLKTSAFQIVAAARGWWQQQPRLSLGRYPHQPKPCCDNLKCTLKTTKAYDDEYGNTSTVFKFFSI